MYLHNTRLLMQLFICNIGKIIARTVAFIFLIDLAYENILHKCNQIRKEFGLLDNLSSLSRFFFLLYRVAGERAASTNFYTLHVTMALIRRGFSRVSRLLRHRAFVLRSSLRTRTLVIEGDHGNVPLAMKLKLLGFVNGTEIQNMRQTACAFLHS